MKRITDFIVDKRNIVLSVFLLLAAVSCIFSSKVNINYDIAKYLPESSETRIGMNIMEDEFGDGDGTLNVMLKGLGDTKKTEVLNYLESLEGIKDVDYESDSEKYNKDDYTLYVITIDGDKDSKVATDVYNEIEEHFKDDEIKTSGDVSERNKTVLALWIIVLAIACALVILIIMCESYIEPFLFLGTIGIAILLNNGTNIMFDSVSNITNSISAILQLALSMDYSIMLMNRYQQEKKGEPDKKKAMKNALYHAFLSISSSSITTIVGLIALVFMSFTIGRDLGFVLAKGVLFSLLSIFTCLPALILLCDKWITKTQKKTPNIKMDLLGKIAYKGRFVSIFLLVLAFGFSYALKGNLGILYTDSETDEVSKVFPVDNQVAVIYKNEYEHEIAEYCKNLNDYDKVDTVLCYGNTINEKVTYDELKNKMKDLGSDVEIDTYLLKIIYYNYYNREINNKMSTHEFVNFIKSEVYKNDDLSYSLDDEMKQNIDKLEYFISSDSINKKRSAKEIGKILGINEEKVRDILIYYNSKNTNTKLSINQFINFMNDYVLKNNKYSGSIDSNTRNNLNRIAKFTNKSTLNKKMNSSEMARLFDMDESILSSLYLYYVSISDMTEKLTISEFANFLNDYVLKNTYYANTLDENAKSKVNMLVAFSNKNMISKSMNSKELSQIFDMNEDVVKGILLLNYSSRDNGTKLTMNDFATSVVYIKNNTNYLNGVDITGIQMLVGNPNPVEYTATKIADLIGMNASDVYSLYAIIDYANGNTGNWVMSPNEFATFILNNSNNPSIGAGLSDSAKENLKLLQIIMESTINNTKYSYKEISKLTGMDEETLKSIYTLYITSNTEVTMTPAYFVNFLLQNKDDQMLAGKINSSTVSELSLVQNVMNGVLNDKKYSYTELSDLLGINKNSLSLIYSLYDSTNKDINISLKDMVNFILDDVMNNKDYSSNFDDSSKEKLSTINKVMDDTLSKKKYSKDELYDMLKVFSKDIDKNLVELLYIYYGSMNDYEKSWTLTIEEFVKYLNNDILNDERFDDFIDDDKKNDIIDSNDLIDDAKELLVGNKYSRVVINTTFDAESEETFNFIEKLENEIGNNVKDFYVIGNSPMAHEMSGTFEGELNFITILTMVFIFVVVAFTFKSIIIPGILVFLIQSAVYLTMGILSVSGGTVYFIAILIVQSILMGATIDYAILYTSYYLESRQTMDIKKSIINSYNKSIHTILTSASILIIATFVIGHLASAIAAKICMTISQGTLCSALLILILLPAILGACDRFIVKKKR